MRKQKSRSVATTNRAKIMGRFINPPYAGGQFPKVSFTVNGANAAKSNRRPQVGSSSEKSQFSQLASPQ